MLSPDAATRTVQSLLSARGLVCRPSVLADRSNLVLALDPLPLVARVAMATSSTRVGAWGIRGEEWKALDSLGRVVGAAKVTDLERYDVTDCDELTLKRTKGEVGAGLFVRGS